MSLRLWLAFAVGLCGVATIVVTVAACALRPDRWPYWLFAAFVSAAAIAAWRLQMQYLGVWPEGVKATAGRSAELAIINLKGCWLRPILAGLAWAAPNQAGFSRIAMTYLIASAIWCPIAGLLHWHLTTWPDLFTARGRSSMRGEAIADTYSTTMQWASGAYLFSTWWAYGWSRDFWVRAGWVVAVYVGTVMGPVVFIYLLRRKANPPPASKQDGEDSVPGGPPT